MPGVQTRVIADNSTSDAYTILDIFAHDRTGLLYAITRTLFELGLSVARAKIGTYLDQVVDVFYVTDQNNRKIEDEQPPGRNLPPRSGSHRGDGRIRGSGAKDWELVVKP